MDQFWDVFSIGILLAPVCIKLSQHWLESRKSGWNRLRTYYRANEEPTGKKFPCISVGMNGQSYQRIATAWVTDEGLYLKLAPWRRSFHPPLLIPWTKMKIVPDGWNTNVQLAAPAQPVSLELSDPIIQDVILQVGRRSPYWLPESQRAAKLKPGPLDIPIQNPNSPRPTLRRERHSHEVF